MLVRVRFAEAWEQVCGQVTQLAQRGEALQGTGLEPREGARGSDAGARGSDAGMELTGAQGVTAAETHPPPKPKLRCSLAHVQSRWTREQDPLVGSGDVTP